MAFFLEVFFEVSEVRFESLAMYGDACFLGGEEDILLTEFAYLAFKIFEFLSLEKVKGSDALEQVVDDYGEDAESRNDEGGKLL
jgi:hypothetical protein